MGAFVINDQTTPQPRSMRYLARPVVGVNLAGQPVVEGYPELEVSFNLSHVSLNFDDLWSGAWSRFNAVMHEPQCGAQDHVLPANARALREVKSVTFGLSEAPLAHLRCPDQRYNLFVACTSFFEPTATAYRASSPTDYQPSHEVVWKPNILMGGRRLAFANYPIRVCLIVNVSCAGHNNHLV